MKNIPNWIIITLVLGLLIASKFLFFSKKENKAQVPGKGGQQGPVAVNYYVVKPGEYVNDVFAAGRVGALNQVDILPEVSGKVSAIYFKDGETVAKGSPLVKLNDADLQAQLQKIRTQLKLAEQKTGRLKKLLEIKGVSQEEFEAQENEVAVLKADEAFYSAQIAKTIITAPFTGVIGLRNISEGAFVNASTPIASLVQMKPLYVEFSLPEKYSELIRRGAGVKFTSEDTESAKAYSATVYAVEPRVDETTKTIKVRAMYDGGRDFYPGAFVRVYVSLGSSHNAIMAPTQAVISILKGQKVFVCRQGVAEEVLVKTGARTERMIQVIEGLAMGDTLITTGLLSLKKGSKLKLLQPDKLR
jgi:membrane fusion protein (multidrug efflux system)